MADFVLVHGAWHGGWCWSRVVDALRAAGHSALAPDLPGHGGDDAPHDSVDLGCYVECVRDLIDELSGDVVLVGHSLGGLTISQVAEHRPDRLRSLVYLAAFIPSPGQRVAESTAVATREILEAMRPSADGHSIDVDRSAARGIFYGDCSDADVAWACGKLGPEPQAVLDSQIAVSADGFGRVPRDYIVCLQDRAVSAEAQRSLIDRHGCRNTYTVDRSHSPFLSAPEELAKMLGEIAGAPA